MKINCKYIWKCIKKGMLLLLPMLFVAMLLYDVITIAKAHYPDKYSIYYLHLFVLCFYISCGWVIFYNSNKWSIGLLISSLMMIYIMFNFNEDIKRMFEHSKCLEVYDYICPKGVILKGG